MENFYFIGVDIETVAFIRFDDPRKFCCHAGVAPFAYTSGSSQHSKNKVSHRANKNIKKLFHLAAVSVTHKKDGELKKYYLRKAEERKNKMLVLMLHMPKSSHGYSLPLKDMNSILLFICEKNLQKNYKNTFKYSC